MPAKRALSLQTPGEPAAESFRAEMDGLYVAPTWREDCRGLEKALRNRVLGRRWEVGIVLMWKEVGGGRGEGGGGRWEGGGGGGREGTKGDASASGCRRFTSHVESLEVRSSSTHKEDHRKQPGLYPEHTRFEFYPAHPHRSHFPELNCWLHVTGKARQEAFLGPPASRLVIHSESVLCSNPLEQCSSSFPSSSMETASPPMYFGSIAQSMPVADSAWSSRRPIPGLGK